MDEGGKGGHERESPRRPLKTRQSRWAIWLAGRLIARRVRPNAISLASVACAAVAGVFLASTPDAPAGWRATLYILAAAGIQLRLLCNMLDGMVAVGGGLVSRGGEIYNDLPDRLSDCFILVGAGYALRHLRFGVELGWCAALLAVMTAYVRVLGGALGLKQNFIGPMAKPHRMATMTGALLLAALASGWGMDARVIALALAVVAAGCVVTLWRRVARMLREIGAAG